MYVMETHLNIVMFVHYYRIVSYMTLVSNGGAVLYAGCGALYEHSHISNIVSFSGDIVDVTSLRNI